MTRRILLCVVLACAMVVTSSAHSVATHKDITQQALVFLKKNVSGFESVSEEVVDLLVRNVEEEDTADAFVFGFGWPSRVLFHFWPALDSTPELPGSFDRRVVSGCSSIQWAFQGGPCGASVGGWPVLADVHNLYSWIAASDSRFALRDPRVGDFGWAAFGRVLHLLEDLTSPAHVRNDPHPQPADDGDPLEIVDRFPLLPPDGAGLLRFVYTEDFFISLGNSVRASHYSKDSAFSRRFPGPASVRDDDLYFYDSSGRRIAAKGPRYLGSGEDEEARNRQYAEVNPTIANDQFRELGPTAVLYAASFIYHYVKKWPLKITVSGPGSVAYKPVDEDLTCTTTCTDNVVTGATVHLVAKPIGTATFSGWSGDCTGATATYEVVVSAESTCTASFTAGDPTRVRWDLEDVVFSDGGTASGWIVFAPSFGRDDVLEWSIDIQGGDSGIQPIMFATGNGVAIYSFGQANFAASESVECPPGGHPGESKLREYSAVFDVRAPDGRPGIGDAIGANGMSGTCGNAGKIRTVTGGKIRITLF